MTRHDALIWLGAATCLVGLVASGAHVLSVQRRRERWAARLAAVVAPCRRDPLAGRETPTLATDTRPPAGGASLLRTLLNYDPARRAYYPLAWWVAPVIMAAPSGLAGLLASKLLGRAGFALWPVIDILLARALFGWAASRVATTLLAQFPDALTTIARAVRIGVPLVEAVRVVGRDAMPPTAGEFAKAADRALIGLPLDAALRDMADRTGVAEYRFFAAALAIQSSTGGALTDTLDNLGETIRKRQAARKRGHALASEARASIYVLTALPIVVGALLAIVNPSYVGLLFTDPGGQKLLAYACFSLGIGLFVMRTITKRALS